MEPSSVRILKWVYLVVFILAFTFIVSLFLFKDTSVSILDFSTVTSVFSNGDSLLASFRLLATFYLLLIFLDTISLFNYKSIALREVSSVASLLGFFLTGVGSLLLIFVFAGVEKVDSDVAVVALLYLVVVLGLFLLDILTFFVEENDLLSLSSHKDHLKKAK